jgi:hypothetical protein
MRGAQVCTCKAPRLTCSDAGFDKQFIPVVTWRSVTETITLRVLVFGNMAFCL